MARETLGAFTPSQITRIEALLKWYEQTGRYVVSPPNRISERREPPPFFIGKANATISAGGNGKALVWSSTTLAGSNEASLGSSETVYSFGGHSAESGDELYIFRHWRSGQLYFLNTKALATIEEASTDYKIPIITSSSTGRYWADLIDGDDCWIGVGSTAPALNHLQPWTSTTIAACSVFHVTDFDNSGTNDLCYMKFDDAGHLIGYVNYTSTWQSPWGFTEPF